MGSLHTRLKRETAPAHTQLETFIAAADLFRTLPGYVIFLRASLAFQAEAEQALAASGAVGIIPDWPRRQRAHLARRDLESLGIRANLDPMTHDRLTEVSAHRAATPEWVLGTAYVMEGATLGGGVLLKSVTRLGLAPGHGTAFLTGYGSDRSAMWQRFLATLERWEQDGIDAAAVVHAAGLAFTAARTHFERVTDSVPEPPPLSA